MGIGQKLEILFVFRCSKGDSVRHGFSGHTEILLGDTLVYDRCCRLCRGRFNLLVQDRKQRQYRQANQGHKNLWRQNAFDT